MVKNNKLVFIKSIQNKDGKSFFEFLDFSGIVESFQIKYFQTEYLTTKTQAFFFLDKNGAPLDIEKYIKWRKCTSCQKNHIYFFVNFDKGKNRVTFQELTHIHQFVENL